MSKSMLSFFRIIKFALQDLGRNLGLSCMTIFILVLMLTSVNVLFSLKAVTKQAVTLVKKQVDVSIYFVPNATASSTEEVKKFVGAFSDVVDVKVQTADEVLKDFKSKHNSQPEVQQALAELGANPFGPTMIIKTNEPESYKKIIDALDVPEFKDIIEKKSFDNHEEAIDRLQNITNQVERVGLGLTVVFGMIAFLVIFNTIRTAINAQRIEIGVKRLVGANNWFIRGPYFIESIFFTIISITITIAIGYLVIKWIDPRLASLFSDGFTLTNYFKSNIFLLIGCQTGVVLVLTIVSSSLAMRRQLKV